MGFEDVHTYIQSGNVLFKATGSPPALEGKIEKALSKEFSYKSRVVVVSHETFARVLAEAPKGFGKEPLKYRYDVLFLKKPLTPAKAMKATDLREGVDEVGAGRHALYFKRLIAKVTSSKISKLVMKPEYQYMTIRNWNTTTKLAELV
jgi:uncharacterized protein (DUF1697 family)